MIASIAILSKHFLTIKKKHIFNPAAFGLFLASILFPIGQSWWGGFSLLPTWLLPLLFVGGYIIIQKVNKFPQIFAFLGTYFSVIFLLAIADIGNSAELLRNPFIHSVLFFAFFMVTDPPTSPAKNKEQVYFGIIIAFISIFIYLVFGGLSFLLVGLLVANGWKAWKMAKKNK